MLQISCSKKRNKYLTYFNWFWFETEKEANNIICKLYSDFWLNSEFGAN